MRAPDTRRERRWLSLAFLGRAVRWKAWYDSKIPFLMTCMYFACVIRGDLELGAIAEMGGVLAVLCLCAAFGYAINSMSDRVVDRVADKPNALASLSAPAGWTFAVGLGVACLALALALRPGTSALILLAAALALAVFYSLPPLRLKERGLLGLVAPAAAQRTLPTAVTFQMLDAWSLTATVMCVLATLIGLRFILVHQLIDADADRRSGVRTLTRDVGTTRVQALLRRFVFPLECVVLAAALALMSIPWPSIGVVVGGVFIWSLYLYGRGRGSSLTSYDPLESIYSFVWPLVLTVLLALREPVFWWVCGFTMLWLFRRFRHETRSLRRWIAGRVSPDTSGA